MSRRSRITWLFAVAFLLAVAVPGPARASVPLPPTFTVHVGPCPSSDALECTDRQTATVYLSPKADRFAFAHALGHLFDAEILTDGDRIWFTRVLGLKSPQWRTGTGLGGVRSPSERFADAYAACYLDLSPDGPWETAYDYQPTAEKHRRVCRAIRRVDARHLHGG